MPSLLEVRGLTVDFPAGVGRAPAVSNVSFHIDRGESVALAGESGSGKSVTALAILRLVPEPGRIRQGEIVFAGEDLLRLSEADMRRIRGGRISMIFQEPMSALNPVRSIGRQVAEAAGAHRRLSRQEAWKEARDLLGLVALPNPGRCLDAYPHQLSGGQRQRVMIAMAIASGPDVLLADEPTAALDTSVQAQILDLLDRLREELGLAVLLITHDLAIAAARCSRLWVMRAGEIVEEGPAQALLRGLTGPAHPYTRALLAAVPRMPVAVPSVR